MDYPTFWEDLKSGKFASMVKDTSEGQVLKSSREAANILIPLVATHDDVEVFYGVFLNTSNRILGIDALSTGSISSASVYPREIIKRALALKASTLILAHNHPSGNTAPSDEDRMVTTHILTVMIAMGIGVLDHIIISNQSYFSFGDDGWLPREKIRLKALLKGGD